MRVLVLAGAEKALEKNKLWPRRVSVVPRSFAEFGVRSRRCMRACFKRYYHT